MPIFAVRFGWYFCWLVRTHAIEYHRGGRVCQLALAFGGAPQVGR